MSNTKDKEKIVEETYRLANEAFNSTISDINRVIDKAFIGIGIYLTLIGFLPRYLLLFDQFHFYLKIVTVIALSILWLWNLFCLFQIIKPKFRHLPGKDPSKIPYKEYESYIDDFLPQLIEETEQKTKFNEDAISREVELMGGVVQRSILIVAFVVLFYLLGVLINSFWA